MKTLCKRIDDCIKRTQKNLKAVKKLQKDLGCLDLKCVVKLKVKKCPLSKIAGFAEIGDIEDIAR